MNKSYSLELHISIQIFNLDSFPWKNTTGLLYTQPWKATQGCSTPSFSMSPMDPNKSSVIFLCIGNFPWMGIGKRCYEPPPIHELSFPAYWPPGISCVAEKKAANATVVCWYCTSVYICNFFFAVLESRTKWTQRRSRVAQQHLLFHHMATSSVSTPLLFHCAATSSVSTPLAKENQ